MITLNNTNYYSTKDVCEKFNVTNETVKRWRDSGLLKFTKISERKLVYSENDLEGMLKGEKS